MQRRLPLLIVLLVTLTCSGNSTAQDTPAGHFEAWLLAEFNVHVSRRAAAFETALKSAAAMRDWQQSRKEFLLKQIGGLPARTPLNPRIVGTLEGSGYRIEKLLLETRPNFHLTANLYLPASPAPWPAVLVPCGHSHDGKAAGQYQLVCRLLARNGMAAICYDPIGQGERYQVLDTAHEHSSFEDAPHVSTPHPSVRLLCTTEHTLVGLGSTLVGGNIAQFRIWDGMRVIDYLQSRPDILPDRIGCTGNSGGGTETAYLMALDDRILAAAPGCYLTTFKKLLETRGPQDGEQNIAGQIAFGLDQADYCIMRAPKPTLICAATRDATFDFNGTMDVFRDAKRFYSRMGYPERMDIAAPDAPHGFTLQLREAATQFMSRWLLGKDVVVREIPELPDHFTDEELRNLTLPDWTPAQLQCTPRGQVLLLPGEQTAFQINTATAAALRQTRAATWNALSPDAKRHTIRSTIAAETPSANAPASATVRTVTRGQSQQQGDVSIQRLSMQVTDTVSIAAIAWMPAKPTGTPVLYLHGTGMQEDSAADGPIRQLVRAGRLVLTAELRGIGETETGHNKRAFGAGRFGPDNLEIFTAFLMGRSFPGLRTDDALAWLQYLANSSGNSSPEAVEIIAIGEAAIPALHAAALTSVPLKSITLRHMLPSWEALVQADDSFNQSVNIVHGALQHYDLPELIDFVGRDRVNLQNPLAPAELVGRATDVHRPVRP
ncbi:MAG: hypothetical protein ACKO2P_10600 [Planctomycetota bacterium]